MKKKIFYSIGIITILTFVAKVIGFFRDTITASFFGATIETDTYYIAYGLIGDVIYAIATAVSVGFLPLYIEQKTKNEERARKFTSRILTLLFICAVIISIIIAVFSPYIARILAPSYSEPQLMQISFYLRILALGIVFSLLTNLFTSLLNAEKIFGYSSFTGIIYSVVSIVMLLLLGGKIGVPILAYAVLISFFIQLVFLYLKAKKVINFSIAFDFKDDTVKRFIFLLLPIMLSNTMIEINQYVDRTLASSTIVGAVSSLSYSGILSQFVTSLVTMTLITVLFTELSEAYASNKMTEFKLLLSKGMCILVFLLLPVSVISCIYARDIVSIVYERGSFNSAAVDLTAIGLKFYAASFVFQAIYAYTTKAFFSLGNTKTPMITSLISVISNIIISIILAQFIGFTGIVLGTLISSGISMVIQCYALRKQINGFGFSKSLLLDIIKIFIASIIELAVLLVAIPLFAKFSPIIRFILATISGGGIYLLTLLIFKFSFYNEIISTIKRRIKSK